MAFVPAWAGRNAHGSVVLPLPWSFVPPLAATLVLPEATLSRKDELHLTLLSRTEAGRLAAGTSEDEWRAFFARHDWSMRLTDRWRLLREIEGSTTAHAVVAEIECDALNTFRTDVGYAAAIVLEPTLPHVTLWVDGTTKGIGLSSFADVERCSVRRLTAAERDAGIAASR